MSVDPHENSFLSTAAFLYLSHISLLFWFDSPDVTFLIYRGTRAHAVPEKAQTGTSLQRGWAIEDRKKNAAHSIADIRVRLRLPAALRPHRVRTFVSFTSEESAGQVIPSQDL